MKLIRRDAICNVINEWNFSSDFKFNIAAYWMYLFFIETMQVVHILFGEQ